MDPVTILFAIAGVLSALSLIAMALEVARRRPATRPEESCPTQEVHYRP